MALVACTEAQAKPDAAPEPPRPKCLEMRGGRIYGRIWVPTTYGGNSAASSKTEAPVDLYFEECLRWEVLDVPGDGGAR